MIWEIIMKHCKGSMKNPPGKVVPLVHINAISFVGHNFIEEGLVFWTAFIRPLSR